MKLNKLLENIRYHTNSNTSLFKNIEIEDIYYDSSLSSSNGIFVAIKGKTVDGHEFIQDAYKRGCRVFITEEFIEISNDSIIIVVEDSRKALSAISATFFGYPSDSITTIGVTGTKGKTSVASIIKSVIESSGSLCGIIGTNGISYNNTYIKTINTTPESYQIHKYLKNMVDKNIKYVVIEVSSGGIMMNRADDIFFDVGIFTNISKDHIGPKEHKDFDDYISCKRKLFTQSKSSIINIDDEKSDLFEKSSLSKPITYSIDKNSMYKAQNIIYHDDLKNLGSSFKCIYGGVERDFEIYMPGNFSIYNALSVIAVSDYLKLPYKSLIDGFKKVHIKGRSEIIETNKEFTIIIDFAHNGISLKNILISLRKYNPKRIITVIGSVGGRTYGRRKELGDVAFEHSDITILTSDNPDFEDPMLIIKEMNDSFKNNEKKAIIEVDREKAIKKAIDMAKKGDLILLAGKGHEEYQLISGIEEHFSEKDIVKKYLYDLNV